MEEEFYASMKLTSGEEVVAKVCYDHDDDVVIAFNPRVVEKVEMNKRNMIVEGIVFDDWMNATDEDMFIIPRNQIITMVELDKRIKGFYEDHLSDKSLYRKSRSKQPNSKRQNPKTIMVIWDLLKKLKET